MHQQIGGDQPGPHEQRHFHQRHARRPHIEDGGDDVDRAHNGRCAHDVESKNGHIHAHAHLHGERRIDRPAPAGAPPGTKNEPISSSAAGGSSQKLQLFMRAKAISGAPIIIGICQLANPTKAGMMAPNTIIRPCMVVSWLKNSGLTTWMPGWNSSARMVSAITPPVRNMMKLNHRYIVPMSLWLVVANPANHAAGMMIVRVCYVVIMYCCHGFLLDAIF